MSCLNVLVFIAQVRTNRMPEILAVILGTTTKVYFQAYICRTRVLAVSVIRKVGLTAVGNQTSDVF
jgi:hypothetical protein